MVKAAAGAMMVRELKGLRCGKGRAGVGGGGAEGGWEDSVVPAGPRGWERRAPIFGILSEGFCGLFGGMLVVRVESKWVRGCGSVCFKTRSSSDGSLGALARVTSSSGDWVWWASGAPEWTIR